MNRAAAVACACLAAAIAPLAHANDEALARSFLRCTVVLQQASDRVADKKRADAMASTALLFALAVTNMASKAFVDAELVKAVDAWTADLKKARAEEGNAAAPKFFSEQTQMCRNLYTEHKARFQALAQPQGPAASAAQPSALFLKTTETMRSSFCKTRERLLGCLQVAPADCETRISAAVDRCTKDPGAAATSQSEGFVRGYFEGCVLTAFLPPDPAAQKEAMACVQQAGKNGSATTTCASRSSGCLRARRSCASTDQAPLYRAACTHLTRRSISSAASSALPSLISI